MSSIRSSWPRRSAPITDGNGSTFTATCTDTQAEAGDSITIELLTSGTQGNVDNVRFSDNLSSAVPEPSSLLLLGVGLAMMVSLPCYAGVPTSTKCAAKFDPLGVGCGTPGLAHESYRQRSAEAGIQIVGRNHDDWGAVKMAFAFEQARK